MDVISLGKAMKTLRDIQDLNEAVIGKKAEDRFKTIDHRLDWIEGQAEKLLVEGSRQVNLSSGEFDSIDVHDNKLSLKTIKEINYGYTDNVVPIMTSYEAPEGKVTEGGHYEYYDGWKAFSDSSKWFHSAYSSDVTWIQYEFPNAKKISKIELTAGSIVGWSSIYGVKNFIFYGSNDGVNYDILLESTHPASSETVEYTFENEKIYKMYKLQVLESHYSSWPHYVAISRLTMMEPGIKKEYATQGTWTSPIIDLGAAWKETRLVDVLKQETVTDSVSIELATSSDGISFTSFTSLDKSNPPQARYTKIRVTLSAAPERSQEDKVLDFDQSNSENTFTLNEYVEANGQLKLVTNYFSINETPTTEGSGKVFEHAIDKRKFKKIERIGVN